MLAGVAAGPAELIARLAERSLELGATLAPDSAWLVRRGIRTLHLRLERASANAAAIAAFLDGHPRVRRVLYPGPCVAPVPRRRRAASWTASAAC